jgi:uncharacterized membrane protein YgcG
LYFFTCLLIIGIGILTLSAIIINIMSVYGTTSTTSEQPKPGTLIVITFENGTTKVVRSTSTNVLSVAGGYLVVDPSVVPSQPLPAKIISKSVVNQFYTAIAIAIGITITEPPTIIRGPSDCLPGTVFDPVNKECDSETGECPAGEIRGRSGYCAVLPKQCPPGTSIDEDPICEPGFNQDCPIGTKLKADKTGCEPIECGDGEILQGDQCIPGVRACDYLAGEECPDGTDTNTEPEPTPELVAPQPPAEPIDPEPEPDPGDGDQNDGENQNEDGAGGDGDGDGSTEEGGGDSSGGDESESEE